VGGMMDRMDGWMDGIGLNRLEFCHTAPSNIHHSVFNKTHRIF